MSTRNNNVSRITIDMPKMDHKRLKALAALSGKSMREMVLEFIDTGLAEYREQVKCPHSHIPNKKTLETIASIERGEDLVECEDMEDFFKKVGLK